MRKERVEQKNSKLSERPRSEYARREVKLLGNPELWRLQQRASPGFQKPNSSVRLGLTSCLLPPPRPPPTPADRHTAVTLPETAI